MRSTPALGTRWALPEIQPGSLAQAPARGAPFGSLGSGRDRQPAPGHPGGPGRAAGGVSRPSATSRRLGDDPGAQSPPTPPVPDLSPAGLATILHRRLGWPDGPRGGPLRRGVGEAILGPKKIPSKYPKNAPTSTFPFPFC